MIINDKRALAYTSKILWIKPISGADNIELIGVLGWTCIAKKGEFQIGDLCVYFEIDSKLPEAEWSEFMRSKHFKIKTMKLNKFKVISQGLALPISIFTNIEIPQEEGIDLTEKLGIVYADEEDNKRKAASADKYKLMAQRKPNIFKKKWARWIMRREWGRKIMFFFFGKKKDKKNSWPQWVVKTDEERCQNMPWLFPGDPDREFIATEKIDGTSTTFTMKGFGRKREFYICSRNVVFDKPDKKCYYETNVYTEMAEKYNIEEVMAELLFRMSAVCDFITIQGETYGEGIQKRDYNLKEHQFMAFNVILGYENGDTKRLNPIEMTEMLEEFKIPCVPIVDKHFKIPKTCDELLKCAGGKSAIDGGMREGLVFRSYDGVESFKAVDPEFLMKYHN